MLRALLLNTDQIAITTSHTLGPELKSGALLRLAGDWTWPTTQTIVYRRRNTASTPLIRSFTRLLQAAAGSA
jgi:DNA-binding transcriptional LysR family regulator